MKRGMIRFVIGTSIAMLMATLLMRVGGDHAEHLLTERMSFSAPGFVQARILVHLVAAAIDTTAPRLGIHRIYWLLSVASVLLVLIAFKLLLDALHTHTHTHTHMRICPTLRSSSSSSCR